MDEHLLCSCGLDITPRYKGDEGWLFHWVAGHEIEVLPVTRLFDTDCLLTLCGQRIDDARHRRGSKFCSDKCVREYRRLRALERAERVCQLCGRPNRKRRASGQKNSDLRPVCAEVSNG